MSSLLLISFVALTATVDKGPLGVRVTTSLSAERIPLAPLSGPIELVVDSLGSRVELRMKKPQPALVAVVARHAGSICPHVSAIATGVELRCRTRRFDAVMSTEGSKKFLDIEELRGLPWREGPAGPPFFHYEPFRTGIGEVCPGSNAVSRGECALLLGRLLQAATEFRSAVDTGDGQLAALRLGDLSLTTGDPATAIGWYRRVGIAGIFGRMARTRVCEIEGTCLASTDVVRRIFDSKSLPDPLRAEMIIRGARAEAFTGRLESATRMLWQNIRDGSLSTICREGGEIICRRVLLQAMREAALAPWPPESEGEDTEDRQGAEIATAAAAKVLAPGEHPAAAASSPTPPTNSKKPEGGEAAKAADTAKTPADPAKAIADTGAAALGKALSAVDRVAGAIKNPNANPAEGPATIAEPSAPEMAIEAYLSLPRWDHGPLAPELSEAAADLAKHLGAPVFGGNLLSAVAAQVSPAMLSSHLLRAAELYLDGDDVARTRLVIEYAHTRIGKQISGRWPALERKLEARVAREDEEAHAGETPHISIDKAEVSREIAAARALSARARLAPGESASKKQGDKQ
jgi:hypothetical protein